MTLSQMALSQVTIYLENGENSEKSNHMLSATSHIELEFLIIFLNMSQLQNRLILMYQRVPLHTLAFETIISSVRSFRHTLLEEIETISAETKISHFLKQAKNNNVNII